MRWFKRLNNQPDDSVAERLEAAEEAKEQAEQLRERMEDQVGLMQGLRRRWDSIHEENHLADLFRRDWRGTS